MPNWVYNALTVTGENAEVERFIEQASRPVTRYWEDWKTKERESATDEVALSFHNFVAPDPSIHDEYWFDNSFGSKDGESNNWYSWNIRNWGVKWDASDLTVQTDGEGAVTYHFSTPWSPPVPAVEAMSAQFPTLSFDWWWEEEQGFGAEASVTVGSYVENRTWDIPNSHKDFVDRDNEEGCVCAVETDPSYLFDDCPGNIKSPREAAVEVEQASALLL